MTSDDAHDRKRVVVLGAGFAGLELTTRLSEEFGDDVEIVLIDQSDAFVFGFSKLDVMFGRAVPEEVRHPYADIVKPGVHFVQTAIRSIDPGSRTVQTDAGGFEADVLVVALGADLDPAATPGLQEGGHEFYTVAGGFAAREVLERFNGGRVIIGVLSTPFKCPPAPSETALLLHEQLVARGLRERSEIALVIDFGRPIPPSPAASAALLEAFAERGIEWHASREVCELDPGRNVAILRDGGEMPYDLFLAVPVHRAPAVVAEAGHSTSPRVSGARRARPNTADAGSATWSSAPATSQWWTSPSLGTSARASSSAPRRNWPPTRPSSARVASSAGSGATGRPSRRLGVRVRSAILTLQGCARGYAHRRLEHEQAGGRGKR
jgi:Pyridine nucleotide-disulphide oxidoreductase